MEIVYLTDIHDNLKKLRYVIQNTEADLYIISGDLIYKAFFTDEKLYNFVSIQEEFFSYLAIEGIQGTPSELAISIIRMPENYKSDFLAKAKEYQVLFNKAAFNMKEKYQIIKDLVNKYARAPTIFLPGNYDMDLQYSALYKFDIHKASKLIDNIKFSGYGGAPIPTSGIPEMVSVVFYEYIVNGKLYSEPFQFFKNHLPDIMILHNPAYGTLDKVPSYGHVGSIGIREYIDTHKPALVLSGHIHSDYGFLKMEDTCYLNPSNFGAVDTLSGHDDGGYFSRIILEKKEKINIQKVIWYKLVEKEINPICEVIIDKEKMEQKILNHDIFQKMEKFLR